ncbi:MAG: hypothetical protein KJ649_06660 [Proteobacteria bacterium]|nr:hypothetical protein [Pseudomonadota bacterium]MBU1744558.1 hypothetical protein [Pseudomonadota bacterium]MBU1966138.1 hypothetical protein [Pseudomonadota bacterium]
MTIVSAIIIAITIIGVIGLTAGILILMAPSTWEKINEKANTFLIYTGGIVRGKLTLVGIIFVLLSLYVLWSAYTLLNLTH